MQGFQAPFGAADSLIATGTGTKTIVQIVAAANHGILVESFGLFGDSIDLDATPIPAELLRQTTAGTMSALTLTKRNDSNGDTLDTTAQHTATAEPTAGDVLKPFQYAPSAGFTFTYPPGKELEVGAGDRVGLRVLTPAADHNVNGYLDGTE